MRDYLWTSDAGCLPFLLIPATLGPNTARGQDIDSAGKDLHNSGSQLAILPIKMNALLFFTTRGEAEDIAWIHFPR